MGRMNLAQWQAAFVAGLRDDGDAVPATLGLSDARGFAVYRGNHRHALMAAMASTFERTRRWVGVGPFEAAAAHHLLLHPPAGWTLDDVGDGFPDTLATLFAGDAEVVELAALEWAMHRVFTAAGAPVLDLDGFRAATAAFDGDDWAALRLVPQPALRILPATTDSVALWQSLAEATGADAAGDNDVAPLPPPPAPLAAPVAVFAWRLGWRPVCRLADADEAEALAVLAAGGSHGDACATVAARLGDDVAAATRAGAMLSRWLQDGLLAAAGR